MLVSQLVRDLDDKYPFSLAEEWDNVGLLFGSMFNEVEKVLTSLDIDLSVCKEAVDKGCNVIVSHHPVFAFDPLKSVIIDDYNGQLVQFIIEHELNIICLHTNVDNMNASMSRWIASYLGFDAKESFIKDNERELGVVVSVNKKLYDILNDLKEIIDYPISYVGNEDSFIENLVIIGGSGSSFFNDFKHSPYQLFMSGDFRYHDFHETSKSSQALVDIGHVIEKVFIKNVLNGINVDSVESTIVNVIKQI